ncbi:hypothetical protein [uncultured Imperialibacter sp.]|uniref:hypothetical protein n=1 Tax=uncultured Imperialibacter sp. TaxID=1672639 RepID=UPI0030D9C0A9|tara:strand:+ start:189 stop:1553 length:1365 start_codon:yes stop_codon:yes gene_type:complete
MKVKSSVICLIALLLSVGCDRTEEPPKDPLASYTSTYEIIQGEIWDVSCVSCHSPGTTFAKQSDLILSAEESYEQLINRTPNNAAAKADGLQLVGDKGIESLYKSFLWEKINIHDQEHFYQDHPQYGSLMPLGGVLTNGELEFIRQWIINGAPKDGEIVDRSILDDTTTFEVLPFEPLAVPDEGIQFHLGPFDVPANTDREMFSYKLLNNPDPIFIKEVEFSMRPGSHHFILYNYTNNIPELFVPKSDYIRDVYDAKGEYVISTLLVMAYHQFVTGTQWPRMRYAFPEGVALKVPANSGFDMNSHYANKTNEAVVGEVYANIYTTKEEEVAHVAEILNLNNDNINIPAKTKTSLTKEFRFDEERTIFQLWSHAHSHMTEFRVYAIGGENDGKLVYISYDWEHPPILQLDPPLVIPAKGGLKLVTTYDNQENRSLHLGLRSTDEMMILFGAYYKE